MGNCRPSYRQLASEMGRSVCVRSKAGVKNALSMTISLGEGIHRRMVYVELEDGYTLEQVTKGQTQNQRFEFNMQINNPALTGQVLVNVPAPPCVCSPVATPCMRISSLFPNCHHN